MAFLEIHHLNVIFPGQTALFSSKRLPDVHAVRDVSLSVEQGSILGLVGESGCGKSTLSRTIMQLQRPSGGEVLLEGVSLTQLSSREVLRHRLDFQMVFQDPYASLNPRYTVFSTLAEALCCRRKLKGETLKDAVDQLMVRVGLDPRFAYKYPHEFSGGQRQRVAIARALAPEPKLIIADEPVSALDVSIRSQILNLLSDLVRDLHLTMIFISHDLSVVHYIADNIAVMRRGEIVEYGTAHEVFSQPKHTYTRSLLAAIPSWTAASPVGRPSSDD